MQQMDVPRVDISLLYEPIKIIPTRDGVQYPQDKFEQLIARSRYMQAHSTPPPNTLGGGGGGSGNVGSGISPYMQQQHYNTNFYNKTSAAAASGPVHNPTK